VGGAGRRQVKLLLDTHIFVWSFLEPERLGRRLRESLLDPGNEIHLSPISVWECLVLAEKGRLELEPDPMEWVSRRLGELAPREAPLTFEVAVRSRAIGVEHDDPADRFLAATAAVYELTLATADQRLVRGKGFRVLANS
jgi:PIN domain nuclease of toxin-antitoxin system